MFASHRPPLVRELPNAGSAEDGFDATTLGGKAAVAGDVGEVLGDVGSPFGGAANLDHRFWPTSDHTRDALAQQALSGVGEVWAGSVAVSQGSAKIERGPRTRQSRGPRLPLRGRTCHVGVSVADGA